MSEVQPTTVVATNGGADAAPVAAAGAASTHVSKFAKKQAQKGGKKNNKKVDEKADEPYVVIIKNAENDFSRIHTEALPIFLNLNAAKALGAAPGESVAPYKQNSNYVIKVRTETRSAEVCFYGEENSSLFKSLAPKNPPAAASSSTTAAAGGAKVDAVKKVVKLNDDDSDDDTPAAMGALSTVQDMVEIIRPRPYYQNPLAYTLETTSKVDATKGGKRARVEETTAEEKGDDDEYATVLGSLKLVEMSLGSKQDKLVSTQMQLNTDLPIKEVRRILKDVPGLVSVWFLHKGTITGGSGGRARHAADSSSTPKADGDADEKDGDDEDADEETVDKHAMVAGGAGSAVFRAVFNDEEALFSAKELLEQFEVSSGVRAMIKLSDGYQRKYDERRREEVPVEEEQY